MNNKLVSLISREEIAETVKRLAEELDRDYKDRTPIVVGILKGSFIFMADLVREMKTDIKDIEFMRLSSYGSSTVSSGKAEIVLGLPEGAVKDQDIIIVEDIVDSGISNNTIIDYFASREAASVKLCVLLDKPARREVPVKIDYRGFTIEDHFIVGYGTDFDQRYRQLPEVCILKE